MKLATYAVDGDERLGLVRADGQLVELFAAFAAAGAGDAPADMLSLIERGDLDAVRRVAAGGLDDLPGTDPATVTWLPPVRRPSKVIGIVINNKAIASTAEFIADHPVFFLSAPSALNGHDQPVVIRPEYGLTHPEAELGVYIGQRVKSVSMDGALDAVFGYTIVNDVTSVDLKSDDTIVFTREGGASFDRTEDVETPAGYEHGNMQLTYHGRSKGTDTFTPAGPWIVTRDEVPDPSQLRVKVFMGDELCTEDSVANLNYGIAEVISYLSRYLTLEPGDLIHMGTAASGKYRLRELDFQTWDGPCAIEIDRIGRLSNPIERVG